MARLQGEVKLVASKEEGVTVNSEQGLRIMLGPHSQPGSCPENFCIH
jgi:hypothetical protein